MRTAHEVAAADRKLAAVTALAEIIARSKVLSEAAL